MNNQIKNIEFIRGIVGTNEILSDGKNQVAFVGRSNVGKSSVINAITDTKIAKSSSTPGSTKQINFFLVNESFYLVDLPGYGYARISKKESEKIRKMILWYLQFSPARPKKIVLIIDALVGPKDFDLEMISLLEEEGYDYVIIANKIDKVKSSKMHKQKEDLYEKLEGRKNVIFFSATKKIGKDDLLTRILV